MGLPEEPSTHPPQPFRLYPILIVAAGLIAYANCYQCQFVFDDNGAIIGNRNIESLWPLTKAMTSPGRTTVCGRPLIALTLAINYFISGRAVWSYHALNVLIHISAALVLFGIVRRTLLLPKLRGTFGNHAAGLAAATALIWVVHPLQVESVTYVIQRCESVMGLLFLLTLYLSIRGWSSPRHRLTWHLLSVAVCAAGMAAKEVMYAAPVAVFLYDWTFNEPRKEAEAKRLSIIHYSLLASTWAIFGLLLAYGGVADACNVFTNPVSPLQYLMTEGGVICYYIFLCFAPFTLCLDYDWPIAHGWLQIAPFCGLVGALFCFTFWSLIKRHPYGFLGACFFLILGPTSSVLRQTEPIFEHRMYLPLAIIAVVAVTGGYHLILKLPFTAPRVSTLCCGLTTLIVCALAARTLVRNQDYRTSAKLWASVVKVSPHNFRGHSNYGQALAAEAGLEAATNPSAAQEHLNQALRELTVAFQLNPDTQSIDMNLGGVLASLGRFDEAVPHLKKAVNLRPDDVGAWYNLANALSAAGKTDEAAAAYISTIALDPNFKDAHYNFGIDLFNQKKYRQALDHFLETLRIDPKSAEAHLMAGQILRIIGDNQQAELHYRTALALKPQLAESMRSGN